MRSLGLAFLVMVLVSLPGGECGKFFLSKSRIPKCPVDRKGLLTEEFQLGLVRPLCVHECWPFKEAKETLLTALEAGLQCHRENIAYSGLGPRGLGSRPLTPEELRFTKKTWNKVLKRVAYQDSCRFKGPGQGNKLCFSAEAVVELVRANEEYCFDPGCGKQRSAPLDLSIVMNCDPEFSLEEDSFKPSPELQDQIAEVPPVRKPSRCLVRGGCTEAEIRLLYFYQSRLVMNLQQLISELETMRRKFFRQKRFIRDFQCRCRQRGCRELLARKIPVIFKEIEQLTERIEYLKRELRVAEDFLARLKHVLPPHGPAEPTLAATVGVLSVRQNVQWPKCRDRPVCDGHNWRANVWINSQCRSVCVGFPCIDRLTMKWCVSQTLKTGITQKNCHANAYTRERCFPF
uniref:SCP domain-containing protein n=1 Tax=Rhodosorus marinus TaxID=101924 RepID=A0A7S2ZNC3_9RHOD|mmetsp:Transcript_26103/g.102434  ORF Transcript_26103/g.102434 Transcript_26103/m.102434 type:complete len:403 (+) Transcript_26103:42-1250(+)